MRLQGLLRWAGRGLAACLLALSVPLLVAGEMAVREE